MGVRLDSMQPETRQQLADDLVALGERALTCTTFELRSMGYGSKRAERMDRIRSRWGG